MTQPEKNYSERRRQSSLARTGDRCTNEVDWELAQDAALDAMTLDQLVYVATVAERELTERGWIRDGDCWRLDV